MFYIGGIPPRAPIMKYAILRTQKLKSGQAVRRSLAHAYREQDTPNADASRTPDNTHIGAESGREALERFNGMLPDKVRKNAVLAVEYLVTASPEAMQAKTRKEQDAYFADALEWLKERHGAGNVVCAGIHRDETTPHMYAYVVPKDERGKLNCRAFLGGSKALSEMQTEFAEKVGRQHGLERGTERSRARHTSIREYYGRVQAAERPAPGVNVPEPSVSERLRPKDYGQRVANSVLEQIGPDWKRMQAKATATDAAREEARREREQAAKLRDELRQQRERADKLQQTANTLYQVAQLFSPEEVKERAARQKEARQERAREANQEQPRPTPSKGPER